MKRNRKRTLKVKLPDSRRLARSLASPFPTSPLLANFRLADHSPGMVGLRHAPMDDGGNPGPRGSSLISYAKLPNNHLTISRRLRRIRTRLARVQYFIRPKATFGEESVLWRTAMWMRSCAACKALMEKLGLGVSVRCQCGWEWQGHTNREPAATP